MIGRLTAFIVGKYRSSPLPMPVAFAWHALSDPLLAAGTEGGILLL